MVPERARRPSCPISSTEKGDRRLNSATRLAVTCFVLGLALGGCGGNANAPEVASANRGSPSTQANTEDVLNQYVDAQRVWVKCLRDHGLDVADPDTKGTVNFGAAKQDPKLGAAIEACSTVQPRVPAVLDQPPPPLTAEELDRHRNYSKCMRANGLPNWPDPLPDGSYPPGSLDGPVTPAEQRAADLAIQICDPVLDGRPPTTPDPNRTARG
jgi:hypothetical protein